MLVTSFIVAPAYYRRTVVDSKRTWPKVFASVGPLALLTFLLLYVITRGTSEISKSEVQIGLSVLALQTLLGTMLTVVLYRVAWRTTVDVRLCAEICLSAWILIFVLASIAGRAGIEIFESISRPPKVGDGRLEHFLQNMGKYVLLMWLPILSAVCVVTWRLKQHLQKLLHLKPWIAICLVIVWFLSSAVLTALTTDQVLVVVSNSIDGLSTLLK